MEVEDGLLQIGVAPARAVRSCRRLQAPSRPQQRLVFLDAAGFVHDEASYRHSAAARSGWPVPDRQIVLPESQGMDSERLAQMLEFIRDQKLDLHSILIARHGLLVHETYFSPYTPETPHAIYSATKSVSSALIGIAIAEGAIPVVQTPLLSLFPDRTAQNVDERKKAITLEHLLMMSSGLLWRRPASGEPPPVYAFQNSDDSVQFVLDRPGNTDPGSQFFYNSGGSHLLSAIVQGSTSQTALDYARQKLFGPLGIEYVRWEAASRYGALTQI